MRQATMATTRLEEAPFVELITFKKDGTPVGTPMLATPRNGSLLLRTHHTAGKLKRLRRNAAVEVAAFSRGRRVGHPERGRARIVAEDETARCLDLLHRHHGMVGRVATWIRHLRGWRDVFIEIELT